MRFLLHNIAYCTGAPRSLSHGVFTLHRYLRSSQHHLESIRDFILSLAPDIVGLVEIDRGSVRGGCRDQVAELARCLSHHHTYSSKYARGSMGRYLPVLRHQGNAILTREQPGHCQTHFFPVGFKRLIVEIEVFGVKIFLVHLALRRHVREHQLAVLGDIVGKPAGPVILAGDFNTFQGREELLELKAATGLKSANIQRRPTYPAYNPHQELDFVLCSPEVRVERFQVLDHIRLSDHLPLLLDFSLA